MQQRPRVLDVCAPVAVHAVHVVVAQRLRSTRRASLDSRRCPSCSPGQFHVWLDCAQTAMVCHSLAALEAALDRLPVAGAAGPLSPPGFGLRTSLPASHAGQKSRDIWPARQHATTRCVSPRSKPLWELFSPWPKRADDGGQVSLQPASGDLLRTRPPGPNTQLCCAAVICARLFDKVKLQTSLVMITS